jgi:hypothetical protein
MAANRDTGLDPRQRRRAETKPFYATSEFMVTVAMTVALFIASTVVSDVDSRLAWILGVSLVGAYVISRGIAKVGSHSQAYDPREEMHAGGGEARRRSTVDERDAPLTRSGRPTT